MLVVAGCSSSSSAPEWAQRNQRVIDEFKIAGRTRERPAVSVPLSLGPGQPVENAALPSATLAPGVVLAHAAELGQVVTRAGTCNLELGAAGCPEMSQPPVQ